MASISVLSTLPAWQEEMQARGKAKSTISGRLGYIRRMAEACSTPGHPLLAKNVGPMQVAKGLARQGSGSARASFLQALRAWFDWATRMHYTTRNQATDAIGDLKAGAHTRKPKFYLPVERFEEALNVAGAIHPQRRMILALMLFTLARQGELSRLQLTHIHLEDRTLNLFRQKTKRYTDAPMPPDLYEELVTWLTWFAADQGYESADQMMREHPDWFLVPRMARHGKVYVLLPDTRFMRLESVVKSVLDGLEVVTPNGKCVRHLGEGGHTIRRSGARALLKHFIATGEGKDQALLRVQLMLNHRSQEMTLRYIGMDLEELELHGWMRTHSMYGLRSGGSPSPDASAGGRVIPGPWARTADGGGYSEETDKRAGYV